MPSCCHSKLQTQNRNPYHPYKRQLIFKAPSPILRCLIIFWNWKHLEKIPKIFDCLRKNGFFKRVEKSPCTFIAVLWSKSHLKPFCKPFFIFWSQLRELFPQLKHLHSIWVNQRLCIFDEWIKYFRKQISWKNYVCNMRKLNFRL